MDSSDHDVDSCSDESEVFIRPQRKRQIQREVDSSDHDIDNCSDESEVLVSPQRKRKIYFGSKSADSGKQQKWSPKKVKKQRGTKKTVKHRKWSCEEVQAVETHLMKFFYSAALPGKVLCEEVKRKEPALSGRPWNQIKFYVKNHKKSH